MRKILAVLIVLACFVPLVSADAFSSWAAYNGGWKSTNDTYTLLMWNTTGSYTWLSDGNTTTVSEYLVVAGGGNGHGNQYYNLGFGGGGGGGLLHGTGYSVSGSYVITVGEAGLTAGSSGTNSSFGTFQAKGGGYGGNTTVPAGDAGGGGGSGGGGGTGSSSGKNGAGGTGIAGQGFDGGKGYVYINGVASGGGGGGCGGAGSNAATGVGGNAGIGCSYAITGSSVTYSSGGPGNGDTVGSNQSCAYGCGGGVLYPPSAGVVILQYETPSQSITASFVSSQNPSSVGSPVTFTSTSTGSPTTFNWTIGGAITNTTENAAYLFDTAGTYPVNLNVTNATGYFSDITINQVVANVSGFTQQDIWMEGQYLQTFHIVDSNNIPIANVTITSTSGNSFTTSNGTGYLTEPFGAATVTFVSDGYTSRAISYVFDSDDTHSVTMYTATPPVSSNVNTIYSPQTVHLTIVDAYGVPQPGAYITVSYIASSLPSTDTNWLTTNFGVDTDVAADMVNSSVLQRDYTGSDGGFVFTAFPVIRYNITAVNATTGMNHRTEITPKDSHYVIYCPLSGQTRGNNTLIARQNATLPWYSLNNTHIMLGMTYQDTTSCTSSVRFRVWFQTNGSEIHNTTWSGFGSALILDNHTILKAPIGTEYLWQYNATRVC